MSQYFPKPFNSYFGNNIKIKIDLSNYATKADIKNISHVNTSSFALKTNLSNLKTEVDKLDIDKLVPIPADLSKLSNVVKNDVVKKTIYNKIVAKVDNIDTSDFVIKLELENKIPDTSGFVKKINSNTKFTKLENKMPDISNLATKTALTTVENKIPSISNLVKTTDYNTKINDIEKKMNNHNHGKYIDTSQFNARLVQANLIAKADFDTKLSSLNKKISKNKADHLIVKNELNKLKDFNSGHFIGKSHFEEDILKLLILIMFYHGHLKDYLMKVLHPLLRLIIFLILH